MHRLSLEDFSELVDAIYRASGDASCWDAFASLLAAKFGGVWVAFHAHNFQASVGLGFIAAHWDPDYVASYRQEYSRLNPWAAAAGRLGVGLAQTSESLVEPDKLRQTRFYNEWVRPQEDIGTGGGITIYRDQASFVRMSTNIRRRDQEKLQADLLRVLTLLWPHLERALRVTNHLGAIPLGAELGNVMDSVGRAVVLLDAKGREHYANRQAEDLKKLGVFRLDASGRLVLRDPAAGVELANAVHQIVNGDRVAQGQTFAVRTIGGQRLTATVTPLVQSAELAAQVLDEFRERRPVAVLCIDEHPEPALSEKFGLTPAESALALSLLEGETLQSFSAMRGIKVDTARKQLKAVFHKTGATKQSQLVSLLARLASS